MKTPTTNPLLTTGISRYSPFRHFFVAAAILLLLTSARSNAGILAEWQTNPLNGNWNNNANWSPAAPNGPSDSAFFEPSSITNVSITANTQVASIVFDSGANAFTITASPALFLTISGNGITNISGITQNFVTAGSSSIGGGFIGFTNSATAGSMTVVTNNGGAVNAGAGGETIFFSTSTAGGATLTNNGGTVNGADGGVILFDDSSTASGATITNNGGAASMARGSITAFQGTSTASSARITNNGSTFSVTAGGETLFANNSSAGGATISNGASLVTGGGFGETFFQNSSTAGNATIINSGGMPNALGGETSFINTSSAGSATIINSGNTGTQGLAGFTGFVDSSTAAGATLIANGGTSGGFGGAIFFGNDSTGGMARAKVFGNGTGDSTNGNLDISSHNAPEVTIGSLEGTGAVFLGARNLTVGSNNLSKTFSGVIQDGGLNGGSGGSLTKTGKGKLSLTKANTYTGGTTVNGGTLLVKNKTGSGTGPAAVQVNAGTLGGTGIINGAVTVGTGTTSGAILLGGNSATAPGTLTMNNTLTFNSLSTYKCVLNRGTPKASTVAVLGVTINSNAPFTFVDNGTAILPVGTIFTVINNTSANPIFGRFSNLAGGSTFTSNGNTFKVSYTGGTGNDLTLKVVQ
jgi:hypothetical protein